MTTWVITDTHFGHDKVKIYCDRPDDWEELVFRNLEEMVKPGDMIYHLGDFALPKKAMYAEMYRNALGPEVKSVLVLGNHDDKSKRWYLNHGFDIVVTKSIDRYVMRESFNKKVIDIVTFSHKPIPVPPNKINIHGHFHNAPQERWEPDLKQIHFSDHNHYLLSLERSNYAPVRVEDVIEDYILQQNARILASTLDLTRPIHVMERKRRRWWR